MKAKFLFVLPLLLGVVLAGCSNDSETPNRGDQDQVLVVKLPGSDLTRAVETPQNTGAVTGTLDDVTVFLLADQLVTRIETFSPEERSLKAKRIEQVSGSITRVIVVANANGADMSGLSSANAIYNYAFTIAQQYPAGKTGLEGKTLIGTGLPQLKTPDPYPGPGPGTGDPDHTTDHIYKEAEVKLEAITSRIEVGDVTPGVGVEDVQLLAVYVNNYYVTNAKGTPSFKGELWTGWPEIPASPAKQAADIVFDIDAKIIPTDYTESRYVDKYNSAVKLAADSKAYAYHVFSNNLPHVILLVRGKYTDQYTPENDAKEKLPYFIGWVTFRKYYSDDLGGYIPEMVQNNIYKMGVGLSGIKINAPDVRPRPEPEDYDLGIKVIIEPWTANVVTPEV